MNDYIESKYWVGLTIGGAIRKRGECRSWIMPMLWSHIDLNQYDKLFPKFIFERDDTFLVVKPVTHLMAWMNCDEYWSDHFLEEATKLIWLILDIIPKINIETSIDLLVHYSIIIGDHQAQRISMSNNIAIKKERGI